jgi:hypothetical protein
MVLTAYSALSPVTGLFATVAPKKLASQELDTSVGASGPHDFAVRRSIIRQRCCHVHRVPPPTSVTIAKRPSKGGGTESIYFCFYLAVKRNFGNSEIDHGIAGTPTTL